MAKKTNWNRVDPDIDYVGNKITLPEDPSKMPLREAIKALERKEADENTVLDVHEIIEAYPMDGAVCFLYAMQEKYGWASPTPRIVETFFGKQEIKPDLLTVKTGPNPEDSVQVPWGDFKLPGVEYPVSTGTHFTKTGPSFVIHGQARKRDFHVIKDLANRTREILKERSIYKGKAIRLLVDDDGELDVNTPPVFISVEGAKQEELILNHDEYDQVSAALWAPLRHTAACEEHGIPLKRGVLLEGTYGTGKTMTANVTGKVCVDNNWTFILLDDVRALKDALLFAQRYQPAVVFAEDVDRIIETRDQRGNDLLNTIDGILAKSSKVITVLTTNHVEKLEPAMLRPGRLDAVVSIKAPDADSVQRLLRLYGRGLIREGEDLTNVGELLAGNIPATIREVAERSKLAMIARGDTEVTEADLIVAAKGMQRHLDLLKVKTPEPSVAERVGSSLRELVIDANNGDESDEDSGSTRELLRRIASDTRYIRREV